jgi:hypothetical protein
MRTLKEVLFVSLIWVLAMTLLISCGSDGKGGDTGKTISCDQVCTRIVDVCLQGTTGECASLCQASENIFTDDAWNKTGGCILQADCGTNVLIACAQQVAGEISDDSVNNAKEQLCTQLSGNCPLIQKQACLGVIEGFLPSFGYLIKLMETSVVDCMVGCLSSSKYCITLFTDYSSVLSECTSASVCNIPLDAFVSIQ